MREFISKKRGESMSTFAKASTAFVCFGFVAMIAFSSANQITIRRISSTPFLGSAAAEISAYDPASKRLFSTNVVQFRIDVFDISNPAQPLPAGVIPLAGVPNSIAVRDGVVAVALENFNKTSKGHVAFFDAYGVALASVEVGSEPDMLIFTPNGRRLLVANEAEPNDAYTIDPEGSVSIIDMTGGVANLTQANVRTAGFTSFDRASLDPSIRIYGPGASVAQDIEPEYIAISHDSKTAWVTLQENNALGLLDIEAARFTRLIGLGFKNHADPVNRFDPSDRDNAAGTAGAIALGNWPVLGMYEPDAIEAYHVGGQTFLVMANEGDTRDYPGFSEVRRVSTLSLDPLVFPNAAFLQQNRNLGRLNVTSSTGNLDGDPEFERLYSFGGRSFSIRDAFGKLIFDSGSQLEEITAALVPASFNSNGTSATFDTRSDDKGPEPEGVIIAKLFGRTYAFICLERTGGLMMYDISNPYAPAFVQYINTTALGDISPESPLFIKEEDSPNGKPLIVVPHEVSGNIAIFEISR
jgi:hypothetical protein